MPPIQPAHSDKPDRRQASLAFIFVTLLIDVLGFGLVIPVLPGLITQLAGGKVTAGAHDYGLLLASYGLMQFLFAPIFGRLSDRFGRRPVLLLSLLVTSFDYVIQATAPTVPWLFVGRILSGITGASFTTASAYIADISPPEKRAQNFGLIGAAFGVGFIVGPAIGGLLGAISPRAPFWGAAALSLINGLYGLFILPESLAPENRSPFRLSAANPLMGLSILTRFAWVRLLAVSIAFFSIAGQVMQATWVLFTIYRFGWSTLENGLTLALVGVMSGIVSIVGTKEVVARMGERGAVLLGQIVNSVSFLLFGLSTRGWMLVAIIPFESLSGVAGPATQSLISRQYGPDEQGAVQGAITSLQSLMGIGGPLLATWVFGYFTAPHAPVKLPGAPFFLGSAMIAVAAGLAWRALCVPNPPPPSLPVVPPSREGGV